MNTKIQTVEALASLDPSDGRHRHSSAWPTHLTILGLLVLLLSVSNARAIVAAVTVWWVSPTYSHCFLIIPVSSYFVWQQRHTLAALTPAAYPRALWLAPPLVLFSLIGNLARINEIEQLAIIGLLQVIILAVLGLQVYRKIVFASLFLFFLVPMGEYLIGPLQNFTTEFITVALSLFSIAHYTEGNVIQLSNGSFEVAEACAGLRFLIATIAIGVLFAHVTYRKWYKIALYLTASVVVPVIANGLRALGIVLLAHWSNNRIATGADHIVYGWGFLVAILFVLMLGGMRFADPGPAKQNSQAVVSTPRAHALVVTLVLSLALLSLVPALLYWQRHRAPNVDPAALTAQILPSGWEIGAPSGEWSPQFAAPDAHLAVAMRQVGSFAPDIDLFVDYYASSRGGDNNLITSTNKLWNENVWHPILQGDIDATFHGRKVHLGELEIASATVTRLVWWTYWSGDRFTTKPLAVKLDRIGDVLSGGGSALVAVSTSVDSDLDDARMRLQQALANMGSLETQLKRTGLK